MRKLLSTLATFCVLTYVQSQTLEFYRIEIFQGFLNARIFQEGIFCSTIDSSECFSNKFFYFKDLNKNKYRELQEVINKIDLYHYPPIIEQKNIYVSNPPLILYVFDESLHPKRIEWRSGKDKGLRKVIRLINESLPKKYKSKYEIITPAPR